MDDPQKPAPARNGTIEVTPPSTPDAPAPLKYAPPLLRGPRRQRVIFLGITSVMVIAALALMLLYLRWYRAAPVSSIIVVQLPHWPEGTEVRVVNVSTEPEAEVGRIALDPSNHMTGRFHVPPGDYDVRVTATVNERRVARGTRGRLGAMQQLWVNEEHFALPGPPGGAP